MPRQLPGRPDGKNPLIYTGTVPNMVLMDRRPTPKDIEGYELGHWWIIPDMDSGPTEEIWVLVSKRYGIAVWLRLATTTNAGIETLTGDTGGQVGPSAGNVNIVGGPGISVVGSPGSNTLTIDASGAGGINTINKIYKTTLGAGTYTVPANLVQATVEVVGGGGGSGLGGINSLAGGGGSSGGGGGYAIKTYTKAELGTSQPYFVGAGGTKGVCVLPGDGSVNCTNASAGENTTFGTGSTLITGTGGSVSLSTADAPGGSGSGGDLNLYGGTSMPNYITSAVETSVTAIMSGQSFFTPVQFEQSTVGANGLFPGGGATRNTIGGLVGTFDGGVGGNGLIIITEYLG